MKESQLGFRKKGKNSPGSRPPNTSEKTDQTERKIGIEHDIHVTHQKIKLQFEETRQQGTRPTNPTARPNETSSM